MLQISQESRYKQAKYRALLQFAPMLALAVGIIGRHTSLLWLL